MNIPLHTLLAVSCASLHLNDSSHYVLAGLTRSVVNSMRNTTYAKDRCISLVLA